MNTVAKMQNASRFSNDVAQVCAPLNLFWDNVFVDFLRFYRDGSLSYLTNNASIFSSFVDSGIAFPCAHYAGEVFPEGIYLLDDMDALLTQHFDAEKIEEAKLLFREQQDTFGLGNMVALVFEYQYYDEMMVIAGGLDGKRFTNELYINQQDCLRQFYLYFREKAAVLIRQSTKFKTQFPKHIALKDKLEKEYFDLVIENFLKQTSLQYYTISTQQGEVKLALKPLQCLMLKKTGLSAKQVAREMGLSPRTVENYLAKLKHILRCDTLAEVNQLLTANKILSLVSPRSLRCG